MIKTVRFIACVVSLAVSMAAGMLFSLGGSAYGQVSVTGRYYASRTDGVPERIILTLSEDPATTASVTWRTDGSVQTPKAQIAVTANNKNALESNAAEVDAVSQPILIDPGGIQVAYHSATFRNLLPETVYCYRVGGDGRWSEWFQFRTASAVQKPFRFVYLGDTQNELKSHVSRVARQAYAAAPDALFFIHAGDLVADWINDDEWGDWFYALGWISGSIPHLAVPGNHEYSRRDASGSRVLTPLWRSQFAFPENGLPGLEETSYYMDYQGARFIFLNTNEQLPEQAAWMNELLADNTNRWTIVTVHHPMYNTGATSGGSRDVAQFRTNFVPVFDAHGVDLVLQGHDHTYARTHKLLGGEEVDWSGRGTVYATSVAGGKMYGYNDVHLHRMAKYELNTQSYQIISIDGAKLRYEAFTASGELLDTFELIKE